MFQLRTAHEIQFLFSLGDVSYCFLCAKTEVQE